jgi:hypothetical protein
MTQITTDPNTTPVPLTELVPGELRVGEPDVAGALAVFPVFAGEAKLAYASFAAAREQGARVTELEQSASVGDLLVHNPTPLPLLLYEGEELLGAQQNRTIDVSVLAAAGNKTRIPVSCVEAGRWDGRRRRDPLRRAPQTAYPELRRAKAAQARERARAGMDARADQQAVWQEVASKSTRLGAPSPTAAIHDVYESRRSQLHSIQADVRLRDGQVGMVAAIGGRITVLDWVSRPEVFATLHGPLVQGYALDALEARSARVPETPSAAAVEGFLSLALDNAPAPAPAVGLGRELRFAGNGAEGSGLAHERELVALSAFANDGPPQSRRNSARAGRIRRPSGRRRTTQS